MTAFDRHPHGVRLDGVMHACPECPLGRPKPFCLVCLGAGLVTEERLNQHVREHNWRAWNEATT